MSCLSDDAFSSSKTLEVSKTDLVIPLFRALGINLESTDTLPPFRAINCESCRFTSINPTSRGYVHFPINGRMLYII